MIHYFNDVDVSNYSSNSQKIRVLSENWISENIFCPSCGEELSDAANNSKACDFVCHSCKEEFELKSKGEKIGSKLVNGAYDTLMKRIASDNNPNLYILHYNKSDYSVQNLLIVPRYFFTQTIIEKRKPLSDNAKRAGWVGCNIVVGDIPEIGKIYYIKDKCDISKEKILKSWQATTFLRNVSSKESRGWLLDTIKCVEKIKTQDFSLDMIYSFEEELKQKYPNNNHIKDKLRQQLQILRNKGYLEFSARGKYKIIGDNYGKK